MSEHEQVIQMLNTKNAAPLELDPARTALIIVDMQRYFTQPSLPFTHLFEKMSPGVTPGNADALSPSRFFSRRV